MMTYHGGYKVRPCLLSEKRAFGHPSPLSSSQSISDMATFANKDPYRYDGLTGGKSYRLLRPGRGMYHDIRRRLPYYKSDLFDALTYRTAASIVRMYFVKYVSTPFPQSVACLMNPSQLTTSLGLHP